MHNHARTVVVVLIALLIPIVPFAVIGELPGAQWLSARDADAPLFALTGTGLLALDVLLPVPSSVVITLLGARLGLLEGWLAAWIGLSVGNLIGYAIGRLWPARWAPELERPPTLLIVFLARPVPILAEATAIASGALRAPFAGVALACIGGNAIYSIVLAASGAALIGGGFIGVGIAVTMLVPALGWVVWRVASKRAAAN